MEIQEKIHTINASIDEIAEFWVKIIFAHIRSKKESEKPKKDNEKKKL